MGIAPPFGSSETPQALYEILPALIFVHKNPIAESQKIHEKANSEPFKKRIICIHKLDVKV